MGVLQTLVVNENHTFFHMNPFRHAHYQSFTTFKSTQNPVTVVCGSHWNTSITFVPYLTIYSPYTIDSIHVWKSVSLFHRNQGNVVYPFRKKKREKTRGELIRFSDVISQEYNNDKANLCSSIKPTFLYS